MRNYDARLRKIEQALLSKQPMEIRIVYCDTDLDGKPVKRLTWGDEPIARVAPGLLETLGTVDDTPAAEHSTGTPAPSSPGDAMLNVALPGDDERLEPWTYERAKWLYEDVKPGPNLRRMRAMARKARAARDTDYT